MSQRCSSSNLFLPIRYAPLLDEKIPLLLAHCPQYRSLNTALPLVHFFAALESPSHSFRYRPSSIYPPDFRPSRHILHNTLRPIHASVRIPAHSCRHWLLFACGNFLTRFDTAPFPQTAVASTPSALVACFTQSRSMLPFSMFRPSFRVPLFLLNLYHSLHRFVAPKKPRRLRQQTRPRRPHS